MPKGKAKPIQNDSRRVATTDDIEVSTYLEIAKEISGEQPAAPKKAVSTATVVLARSVSTVESSTHASFSAQK